MHKPNAISDSCVMAHLHVSPISLVNYMIEKCNYILMNALASCEVDLNDQPFLLLKIELVLLEQPIIIFELIVKNIAETIFKWKIQFLFDHSVLPHLDLELYFMKVPSPLSNVLHFSNNIRKYCARAVSLNNQFANNF